MGIIVTKELGKQVFCRFYFFIFALRVSVSRDIVRCAAVMYVLVCYVLYSPLCVGADGDE